MKEKGLLKDFWENFEEYLCSAALLVMTFVTFMNVFSRKITWFNMSFTQELVTTMFVWVCCLAAASVFKTDSHSITIICLQAFWRCLSGPSESPFHCQRFFP